jgi:molybdopterin/thiamine biosynthesis adenylyltransferase
VTRPELQEIRLDPASAHVLAGLDRSARMPGVLGARRAACDAFGSLTVAALGAGSVGAAIVDRVARLGVRAICIVDPGSFKSQSTLTHPIGPEALGCRKAAFVAARAKAVCPEVRVFALEGPLEQLPTHVLAACDVALLATDNLLAEVAATTRCAELGIPLIQGAVHGPTLVAQVRRIANRGDGPCLACGYERAEWQALEAGARLSCQGDDQDAGVASPVAPTMSFAHLCGIAADLAVMELTRHLLGITPADASEVIEYRGVEQALVRTRLAPRHDCPVPHARCTRIGWDLAQASVAELLERGGCGDADATLSIENHVWSELEICACDRHQRIARFLPDGADLGMCPECNVTRLPHPFGSRREVPLRALTGHLDRTLAELGAISARSVYLRGSDGIRLFHAPLLDEESGREA